jgi:glycosyltransferase involved in cell wall biosynthesis
MELNNLAFINYTASGGGAGRICSILHQAFDGSFLYNKFEQDLDKGIVRIDNFTFRNQFHKTIKYLLGLSLSKRWPYIPRIFSFILNYLSEPLRRINIQLGKEDFCFPGTSCPSKFLIKEPTLVHLHNPFPDYFDLRSLKVISEKYPLLITAHDCWLMTGHCAHPIGCHRFKIGCGHCPDLTITPSIVRDNTRQNLDTKIRIYDSSKMYLATPCNWLKEKFLESKVGTFFEEIRVIPNGIKTDHFFPIPNKQELRKKYDLSTNALIFCFVGNRVTDNPWKNFQLMLNSLKIFAQNHSQNIIFLCVGEERETISLPNLDCRFIKSTNEIKELNEIYNCADYYLHLAKADTFPNTILEAQSCGLPVFANPVCGIPEQILENKTGWFLKSSLADQIAEEILAKVSNCDYEQMTKDCRDFATTNFSAENMISEYKKYYSDILIKQTKPSRN